MHARPGRTVPVNGRDDRFPSEPTVVVCIDGSEPGSIEAAVAAMKRFTNVRTWSMPWSA